MREKGLKMGKILKLGVLVFTIIEQKKLKSCKSDTKKWLEMGFLCNSRTIFIQ